MIRSLRRYSIIMKSYLPEKFTLEFDFWVGPFYKKREMMSRKIAISYVFTNPNREVVFKLSILTTGIIVLQTIVHA